MGSMAISGPSKSIRRVPKPSHVRTRTAFSSGTSVAEMLAKLCRARSRRIIGDERARLDIQRSFLISSYSSLVISPFAYRFFRMSRADSDSCLSPWP